ncbi:hypothetical protein ABBQ32_005465 [Trebouxia sp. C0010 RCD-2024]
MAVSSEPSAGQAPHQSQANEGLIAINLTDLEAETRCPVCLGVIKNARLVSGCMHRFCAECIEKWLRVCRENNCPQCRMPMQSRRDCKKDGKYDRLLRLLYDDIQKYETEMLDADDVILEQAMQTGAALKRARDLQKAARKPKVEYPQATGNVRSDSTSPRQSVHQDAQQGQGGFQQPLGSEPKGAYRTITVGPHHWPSRPHADMKSELQEALPSPGRSHELPAPHGDLGPEEVPADPSSSTGHLQQLQAAFQDQSRVNRWVSLHKSADNGQATTVKRDPDTDSGTDKRRHRKQQEQQGQQKLNRPGQHQTASSRPPSHGPIGSPAARIVSLSSLQLSAQQPSAQRAPPGGMPSFPVGSTTGIVGRGWVGQPQYASNPIRAGDGKGTKRPGGDGESKGKKRQRRSDREKSVDGEGRQSTGPIAAFLRALPPSQPEEEAKAQAASLAATAAAAAKQQEVTLHGDVQVCLMPDGGVPEGSALPALDKPFLQCPARMRIRELQKVIYS